MNWIDMQKQYLDALQSFGQPFEPQRSSINPGEPWMQAMDFWWQQSKPQMGGLNMNTFQRLMNESRNFYVMAEQLTSLLNQINSAKNSGEEWISSLNSQFEEMKEMFTSQSAFANAQMSSAMSQDPLNNPFNIL